MKERTYVDDIDRSVYDIKDKENDAYKVKAGLTPEIVEKISKEKNDPAWMQQFRLQSLQIYNSLQVPNWGPDIEDLDMDNIVTYVRPKSKMSAKWSEVPKDIKDTFERLGIPQAEQKSLAGVGAQYDSELVYHNVRAEVAAQGVVYTDLESAMHGEYAEMIRTHFMHLVKPQEHKFAALHGAVWSGGSFVYVPKGVSVTIPLQSYFRLNAPGAGQFEHTLIIVDDVVLSKQKPLPYEEQIQEFVRRVQEAECIVVGGASGLSAAGGGDFYYSDTPSFREHFGKFADKYGFKGAFSGMMHRFSTRNEHWGYVATFLNTTQNAPIREPYLDLDRILQGKDFHILTTNQDTQFVKIYPEEKVSEIQGDHRFFQCSQCCQDETWDAVQPVADMIAAMGEGTMVPDELIPRCPHCGAEMFPWVRGYGNFLQGKKYEEEYEKISKYIQKNKDRKILLIELGVGRMTPMFIQEPFWELTNSLKDAYYISVNSEYQFLPEFIENKGIAILGDIGTVLKDLWKAKEESAFV